MEAAGISAHRDYLSHYRNLNTPQEHGIRILRVILRVEEGGGDHPANCPCSVVIGYNINSSLIYKKLLALQDGPALSSSVTPRTWSMQTDSKGTLFLASLEACGWIPMFAATA